MTRRSAFIAVALAPFVVVEIVKRAMRPRSGLRLLAESCERTTAELRRIIRAINEYGDSARLCAAKFNRALGELEKVRA